MSEKPTSSPDPAGVPLPTPEEDRAFRRLRLAALLAPLAFVLVLGIADRAVESWFSTWVGRLLAATVAAVLVALFYAQVFDRLGALRQAQVRKSRELLALHRAGLAVASDLSLDSVLQTVVDGARSLVATRYGALSVIHDDGRIRSFVTSGIPREVHERIGDLPRGRGLLGVVLQQGQRLRLEDLQKDPRSVGFPEHHPQMRTLLAVPITCRGPHRGNLYLSEKEDKTRFTQEDEDTLVRFAAHAAVAIDNAYLHREVRELGAARERLRIAHEMHDGLAQILAYVNTKAQVVREHLRRGRADAAQEHLEQLAEAARSCYVDVRGQILELRTAAVADRSLAESVTEFVRAWEDRADVEADLEVSPGLELPPDAELQVLRILQESLTNVRKHAGASRVTVRLLAEGAHVRLVVVDDGVGLAESPVRDHGRPRFGLSTMKERSEAAGGTLEITSSPGEGTRVEVTLPWPEPVSGRNDAPADR